jgi:hypothetical protein
MDLSAGAEAGAEAGDAGLCEKAAAAAAKVQATTAKPARVETCIGFLSEGKKGIILKG